MPIAPLLATTQTKFPEPILIDGECAEGGGWSLYLIFVSAEYTHWLSDKPNIKNINNTMASFINLHRL